MVNNTAKLAWKQACEEYDLWNRAIYEHFVGSVPRGGQVFLSVDGEALDQIGKPFGKNHKNFLEMIRGRAVRSLGIIEVAIDKFHQKTEEGEIPDYMGFLAAMVLAADWMEQEAIGEESDAGEREVIDDTNYFFRLRQVLGLEAVKGRPPGLLKAEEAPFWEAWNEWLRLHDREPTAEEGENSYRYISYPLSQSMLHEADKKKLARLFWELVKDKKLSPTYDRGTLLGWMQKHARQFDIPRLWQLLDRDRSRPRYEATADSVFDLYCSLDWDAECEQCEQEPEARMVRRFTAELYREEDPFAGEVCYYLYPRQPKGWGGGRLEVEVRQGQWERLRDERAGWCRPLSWGPDPPASDLTRNVKADGALAHLKHMIFPHRNYWILIADPWSNGAGAFATWGGPVLGKPFIVLCRPGLAATMALLRERGLITWLQERTPAKSEQHWREYLDCRVLTADWPKLTLRSHQADLADDLRPRSKALVYLDGGLRVPHERDCWLRHYPPRVEVVAGAGQASLYCEELRTGKRSMLGDCSANTVTALPDLAPGFYRIGGQLRAAAGCKDQILVPRHLEIRAWEQLACRTATVLALAGETLKEAHR
jgi:hypothetical protein